MPSATRQATWSASASRSSRPWAQPDACRDSRGLPPQRARLEEIRDNLHARIAEARREGWLGEADGLQISLNGARQKLAQLDQLRANETSTQLGMPTFTQIAGRSIGGATVDAPN